ncbi:hypothetical protein [Trichococcus collinsii]|uniref:Uncharacterized protein n=1 Tax=Trichococcus collinsii TaxID=157076 RepID=A0AB37ZXC7_9LACT|nr:hypothetical protein [Trichococcus collinsii]CZR02398.1 Hypothetical protein Tcol_2037 [Trichococcus collinsii]SDZ94986.1 hypothetical protein SAMN04488525_101701 [Trichococcus collinsii]
MIKTECIKRDWDGANVYEEILISEELKARLEQSADMNKLFTDLMTIKRDYRITDIKFYEAFPLINHYVLSVQYTNPFQ